MEERIRRWRLVLGAKSDPEKGTSLDAGDDAGIDATLEALYDSNREGGLGASSPNVNRWLGDIRRYFPSPVVEIMQRDALERLELNRMLLEPELLASIEPNAELVGTLLSLSKVLPERSKESAREVVKKVVEKIEKQLGQPLRRAIRGSLQRANRTRRPRPSDIDWRQTIRTNLKHYQSEYKSIIPEQIVGYQRRRNQMKQVIVLIDQSGSMATSVVYAGIFSCIMATMPSLRTEVVAFDTAVVDLTEHLQDPIELLFATRLGGGTDINKAMAYAEQLVQKPKDTILILISDLFEGGNQQDLLFRVSELKKAGVNLISLLALSDNGAPSHNRELAGQFANLDIPSFACTPEQFPELLADALLVK